MTTATIPSPEATGGAGHSFEVRAFAVALARLLRGDRVPGLDVPPARVRLQQRVAGAVLDDVVLDGDDRRGGAQSVEYQVKRRISPTEGDTEFVEIVRRCLGEIDRTPELFEERRRRFGIASRPSTALRDLARVTDVARSHDMPAGFLDVVRGTSRQEVRQRLDALRAIVTTVLAGSPIDTAVDLATWRVARALYVWPIDAEPDGHDVLATLDRLTDLLPPGSDPERVFGVLTEMAQAWNPQAGAVDLAMLRRELEIEGVALDASPARRAAFDRLRVVSAALLDSAAARLGHQLHLPRRDLRRRVAAAIEEHEIMVLGGRAGVGKSILARLVAGDLLETGAAVAAISLSGRTAGLGTLQADLGVSIPDALAGAPIGGQRILLIDGAEQALTDGGALLGSLLAAIPLQVSTAPPWKIILTAREEAVGTLARLVAGRTAKQPHTVVIPGLTDDEVAEILVRFPRLAPLARNERSKALLLRRPYLVDLLVRVVERLDLPGAVAGEEDLIEIITERLVRRDDGGLPGLGAPDARADVYLALADGVVTNRVPARLDGLDAEARAGLASDDVIARTGASWRFAHDILADYAVASLLLEPDGDARLAAAIAPRRLLRAVRLRLQRRLGDALRNGRLTGAWARALAESDTLVAADGPRWRDVPWEAVLNLGGVRQALNALTAGLFAGDSAGLLRLIDVTERLARRSTSDDTNGPLPLDVDLSAPVVDLLTTHGGDVPQAVTTRAARLVHEHLEAAYAAGLPPDSALDFADRLPDVLVRWADADEWGDRLEYVVGSLALCGARLAERHDEFLVSHARNRPHEVAEPVESPLASRHLSRTRPDLLLRLAGLYYLGIGLRTTGVEEEVGHRAASRRSFASEDREGVRDHDPKQSRHLDMWPLGNNQSNPALGPFAALLDASPQHGLRLVGAVVDAATAARTRLERGDEGHELHVELNCPGWPTSRRYTGTRTVWLWHRRTSVGPGPALSALMAMRAWGVRRVRHGEAPAVVRDDVLSAGTSLAFVSVAVSILVDTIDSVGDELDMFLEHPLLWHLEHARVQLERGTALDIPDALRLSWALSNVAMALVFHSGPQRREQLRRIGECLVANHAELHTSNSELLARGWANALDVNRFVTEEHEDGVAILVDQPMDIVSALDEAGGGRAARSLHVVNLMMRAIAIRDGKESPDAARSLWHDVVAACEQDQAGDAFHVYQPGDVIAAAATAVVLAAATGQQVDDGELASAVEVLLAGADYYDTLAPADVGTGDTTNAGHQYVPDMAWDMGADRSIATALPMILLDPSLCVHAGVILADVSVGIRAVASTPYDEARVRLLNGLRKAWAVPCATHHEAHLAVLTAARRMIATAGLGPRTPYGYSPATLPEPFEDLIAGSDGFVLDLASASYAVVLLADGAGIDCEHGRAATALLDVLVAYDRRVWPAHYAREHYQRAQRWRHAIDEVSVDRILDGDDNTLQALLDSYAPVGEELRGVLSMLAERASAQPQVIRVHQIWPRLLDRLLPEARDLSPRSGNRDNQPFHRDVDELDGALLLMPPAEADDWPVQETIQLGIRWLHSFQAAPHIADRALAFLARIGVARTDTGVEVLLGVLGDNINAIRREARYVVAWLEIVLADPPAGPAALKARTLLDRLAAAGDDQALNVQQRLEA